MRTQIAFLAEDQASHLLSVRVMEPPSDSREAMRGRLYVFLQMPEETLAKITINEQVLSTVQRIYYSEKGSQAQVMTLAMQSALDLLQAFEQRAHRPTTNHSSPLGFAPGIMMAALLKNRLLLMGSGSAFAIIANSETVELYPSPLPDDEQDWTTPFALNRQEFAAEGAFLITTRECLDEISLRDLAGSVAYVNQDNLADVVSALRTQVRPPHLSGILVLMTPGEELEPAPAAPTSSGSSLLTPWLRRSKLGGLPTAVHAPPPVHDLTRAVQSTQATATSSLPDSYVASQPTSAPAAVVAAVGAVTEGDIIDSALQTSALPTARDVPSSPAARRHILPGLAEGAKAGLQRAKELLADILPNQNVNSGQLSSSADLAASTTQGPLPPVTQKRSALTGPATPARLQPIAPVNLPARATGGRARLFILVAVLILLLTPVVVAGVFFTADRRARLEAEQALDMAEARFVTAQEKLTTGDKAGARTLLTEAQDFLGTANNLVGGRLPRADDLSVRINRELAEVLQIRPLAQLSLPLLRFPPEAQPQRILVIDQDIFILDTGRQFIQHFVFDPTNNIIPDQEGEVILREGQTVDNVAVGRPVAMAWQPPIPGYQDKAYLLVLDRNNNIFRYNQRLEGITRLSLGASDRLRVPTQIMVYSGRLYVADEGASQIFRYPEGDYSLPPNDWFAPDIPVNLTGLRSMAIDGNIWLLDDNGMVLRYGEGKQVPFSLDDSAGKPEDPVDLAVGDQGDSLVYLADKALERVLVFNKNGIYLRQFQAPEGHLLRDLRGIYVDEVASKLYLLTQSSLFQHPLPTNE